jgi:DNA-binding CsgD family transcriptional regulator
VNEPAAHLVRVIRVAVTAADDARRVRLERMVAGAGHAVVASPLQADVVLSDGESGDTFDGPIVSLGEDAGAAGVLPADATADQIDAALRAVANGLTVRLAESGFEQAIESNLSALLTPREIEILVAVGEGLPNKAIARKLDISQHTVKFHMESVFRKLGVRTRAEAVARGLQRVTL